ncbi:histidine phosphatase family protein [Caviibacter abscessus]|uniref:hypothetical protein n=1 Tax=Caviibacter abscessus TaxID=1766719 RepID=UPI00083213F5|nr:hypothetical protein [Caviibacter abscessus]
MKIKKILIFSRHGLRYPLINNSSITNWEYPIGDLTLKGSTLEYLFGQHLNEMLDIKDEKIYFLSNSMKRTYLTARALALAFKPYEDTKINMKHNTFDITDDRFNLLLKNKEIINNSKIDVIDEKLKTIYETMENILKLKKGTISNNKSVIWANEDGFILVDGALKIATDICDLFLLKYYEGFKKEDIFVSNKFLSNLKLMSKAKDEFLELIFTNTDYINNSKENIYNLVKDELSNIKNKVSVFVGHDSNLATLMKMFNIKYKYPNKYSIEKYPVGAKLIFKVFEDNSYEIYYSYFDYKAIRNFEIKKPYMFLLKKGNNIKDIIK